MNVHRTHAATKRRVPAGERLAPGSYVRLEEDIDFFVRRTAKEEGRWIWQQINALLREAMKRRETQEARR